MFANNFFCIPVEIYTSYYGLKIVRFTSYYLNYWLKVKKKNTSSGYGAQTLTGIRVIFSVSVYKK